MIYAEIVSGRHYDEVFPELLAYIKDHFSNVESGAQGDSWIWIFADGEKVAVDTFSSMRFQIKSDRASTRLAEVVMTALGRRFELLRYPAPEWEADDEP